MNILITSAGRRVSLVRAFQEELRGIDASGQVLTTDLAPHLSAACHVSDRSFALPRLSDPDYLPQLAALCRAKDVRLLVPTLDTELLLLANARDDFRQFGTEIVISSPEFVTQCRDKRLIHQFFRSRGVDAPEDVDRNAPTYPLFVKPVDGSLSVDTFLVRGPEDLQQRFFEDDRFMFMEYVAPDAHDEYTVDMYFDRGGEVRCIVPRKRLLVRAGEINKGLTCRNALVPFLKDRFARIDGAVGCLTLQVFLNRDSGRVIAIEINPRFGGGYPLSYHAGANYPRWLIQEYLDGEAIPYRDDWTDQLLMLRYDDEVIVRADQDQQQ